MSTARDLEVARAVEGALMEFHHVLGRDVGGRRNWNRAVCGKVLQGLPATLMFCPGEIRDFWPGQPKCPTCRESLGEDDDWWGTREHKILDPECLAPRVSP